MVPSSRLWSVIPARAAYSAIRTTNLTWKLHLLYGSVELKFSGNHFFLIRNTFWKKSHLMIRSFEPLSLFENIKNMQVDAGHSTGRYSVYFFAKSYFSTLYNVFFSNTCITVYVTIVCTSSKILWNSMNLHLERRKIMPKYINGGHIRIWQPKLLKSWERTSNYKIDPRLRYWFSLYINLWFPILMQILNFDINFWFRYQRFSWIKLRNKEATWRDSTYMISRRVSVCGM